MFWLIANWDNGEWTIDYPQTAQSAKAINPPKASGPSKQKLKLSKIAANVKLEWNKFVEDLNLLLPSQIPIWSHCMASINQHAATQGKLAYFISEPALIVGLSDNARKLCYIQNWLLIQDAWYHLIMHNAYHQEPLHQQFWWDYLNNKDLSKVGDLALATGE